MGIIASLLSRRDARRYVRSVRWREQNSPQGTMFASTVAYNRTVHRDLASDRISKEFKAEIKSIFLSNPDATPEDFERCWPELRDQILRNYVLNKLSAG